MKNVMIYDCTLAEASALTFKNRLDMARELDQLGADILLLPSPAKGDEAALLVRTLGTLLRRAAPAVAVGLDAGEAELAAKELKGSPRSVLTVSVPVSASGMEYLSGVKPDKLPTLLEAQLRHCASLGSRVFLEARDATRAEPAFLLSLIQSAVRAGATGVILCDSEGKRLPWELAELWREPIAAAGDVPVFAACSDALGLGAADTLASLRTGAAGAKVSIPGGENCKFGALAAILRERGESLGFTSALEQTRLKAGLERMTGILDSRRRSTSPFDNGAGAPLSATLLSAGAEEAAVEQAVRKLGYELSPQDMDAVYESFTHIAEKKDVDWRELDAIVANAAQLAPPTYKLESYVVHTGNVISATADIQVRKDGQLLRGLAPGDGPIDAAFLALEQISGRHYELDDFQISAVTEGREAMGSALIGLRDRGRVYPGSGISTDIIGACINAYLAALNKIAHEGIQS